MSKSLREMYASTAALIQGVLTGDTKRDLYKVAGYPINVDFENFFALYERSGIGYAGITKPVDKCWSTMPKIYDHDGNGEPVESNSKFMQDFRYLQEKFDILSILAQFDEAQRVGEYGGIIISSEERVVNGMTPRKSDQIVGVGVRGIIGFRPVFQGQIEENDLIDDINSRYYGNPKTFKFNPSATNEKLHLSTHDNVLHWSRVFAMGEGAFGDDIRGMPALKPVINDIYGLFKTAIAGSEGLYKNAKQRLHFDIKDPALAAALAQKNGNAAKELDSRIKRMHAGFDDELLSAGVEVTALQSAIQDPTGAAGVHLQAIVAGLKIPKTELIGFETGERSSSENSSSYNVQMQSRREKWCTRVIKCHFNHLIMNGMMSAPDKGVYVEWDDLAQPTDAQRLDNVNKMADINKKSIDAGLGEVFTPEEEREMAGFKAMLTQKIPDDNESEDDENTGN